ncbi:hypothetical protein ABLB47_02885 [Vibrio parahaemolyticus]|nr:hypothetical protein [Vibrio parahaemolyticus]
MNNLLKTTKRIAYRLSSLFVMMLGVGVVGAVAIVNVRLPGVDSRGAFISLVSLSFVSLLCIVACDLISKIKDE